MKEIHTEIEIQAPADRIWRVLTDFAAYPEWNPFVRRVVGEIKVGSRLHVFAQPSGGKGMWFRPKVLVVDPCRELRWLGHLWVPGLFHGEHTFVIESRGEGCARFIQREQFEGLLLPLLSKMLEVDTRRGFEEMNQALKARYEAHTRLS
jgi:hypothetical protein